MKKCVLLIAGICILTTLAGCSGDKRTYRSNTAKVTPNVIQAGPDDATSETQRTNTAKPTSKKESPAPVAEKGMGAGQFKNLVFEYDSKYSYDGDGRLVLDGTEAFIDFSSIESKSGLSDYMNALAMLHGSIEGFDGYGVEYFDMVLSSAEIEAQSATFFMDYNGVTYICGACTFCDPQYTYSINYYCEGGLENSADYSTEYEKILDSIRLKSDK